MGNCCGTPPTDHNSGIASNGASYHGNSQSVGVTPGSMTPELLDQVVTPAEPQKLEHIADREGIFICTHFHLHYMAH